MTEVIGNMLAVVTSGLTISVSSVMAMTGADPAEAIGTAGSPDRASEALVAPVVDPLQ